MNWKVEEIESFIGISDRGESLYHYGTKRHSGRYPWGSGNNPYQHSGDFLSRVDFLRKSGMSDSDIAKLIGAETNDPYPMDAVSLKIYESIAKRDRKRLIEARVMSLAQDGYNDSEIARMLGYSNESSIRNIRNGKKKLDKDRVEKTAEILRQELEEKGMVDIGKGADLAMHVSEATLTEAAYVLMNDGYHRYGVGFRQVNSTAKNNTTNVVLTKPDIDYKYVYDHPGEVQMVGDYVTDNGGTSWRKREYPASMDSSRIYINYDDGNGGGGSLKDGTIEIRPGVADLNLGDGTHYAQVRIMVDGTHYMKGMALYADDIPEGYDVRYNTNKQAGAPFEKVFKPLKTIVDDNGEEVIDISNPFGAYIKPNGQSTYIGDDGQEHLSVINKLKSEGDWEEYQKTVSSQFLSKQPLGLIKSQLNKTYDEKVERFDEINSITNPTLRKKMLEDFSEQCAKDAVSLKAIAFPRQTSKVILPLTSIADDEVYAPTFNNGEKVALIRYPHGGTFEIPILTVNNKNKNGKTAIGPDVTDAIGINKSVADRLSGADFDGDTVMIIPLSDSVHIVNAPELEGLKGFNTKDYQYSDATIKAWEKLQTVKRVKAEAKEKGENLTTDELLKRSGISSEEEYKRIRKDGSVSMLTDESKGKEMGVVSNLITDMTLQGAASNGSDELARAVRHSMVVIDAAKHHLDYKQSYEDNRIDELKRKYQTSYDENGNPKVGGAVTLISKHKQDVLIPETRGTPGVDPETGKKVYRYSGRTYRDANGNIVEATSSIKLLNKTEDLHTLSSGTKQEEYYADYGNKMNALGNKARLIAHQTKGTPYNASARKVYDDAVRSIDNKLEMIRINQYAERMAQRLAQANIKAILDDNPKLKSNNKESKEKRKKLGMTALDDARTAVGKISGKESIIKLSDREWEAIQLGAVSSAKALEVFGKCDPQDLLRRALPKTTQTVPVSKEAKVKAMYASGNYTISEIASSIGVSSSTISRYIHANDAK